jgi:hypothetical protein
MRNRSEQKGNIPKVVKRSEVSLKKRNYIIRFDRTEEGEERRQRGERGGGLIYLHESQSHLLSLCLILAQDLCCMISTDNRYPVNLMVVNMSSTLVA